MDGPVGIVLVLRMRVSWAKVFEKQGKMLFVLQIIWICHFYTLADFVAQLGCLEPSLLKKIVALDIGNILY